MMAPFDNSAWFYDLIRRPPVDKIIRLANPKKTDTVLDIGGGTGIVAATLKPHVRQITIIDSSAAMLVYARQREISTITGSAENLPFKNSTFDLIILTDAFHHIRNQPQALKEIRRVLKPRGRVVLEEIDPSTFSGKLTVFIEWLTLCRSKFHKPKDLKECLEKAGFSLDAFEQHGKAYFLRAVVHKN